MPPDKERSAFVALPSYGEVVPEALPGLCQPSRTAQVVLEVGPGSLLALVFNRLWCRALNERRTRCLTHFAMHHADVQAPPGWLDVLLDEQERVGADILSVVLPIKDSRGLTSTGIRHAREGNLKRFTMAELDPLPRTFDISDIVDGADHWLMINTGLWVCDFTQPWVEEVCFSVLDNVERKPDGSFRPQALPEDWNFSGWAARRGLKVYATRVLNCVHHGRAGFRNDTTWGEWTSDRGDSE